MKRIVAASTTAILLAAGWIGAPAAQADPPSDALCGQVVGGLTVTAFATDGDTPCVLKGPGTFTIAPGGTARFGNVTLAKGLRVLNKGVLLAGSGSCTAPSAIQLNAGAELDNASSFTAPYCADGHTITGSGTIVNEANANWVAPAPETLAAPFDNRGTMVAAGGELAIRHPVGFGGGTLGAGVYTTANDGWFGFPGPVRSSGADLIVRSSTTYQRITGGSALSTLTTNTGTLDLRASATVGSLANSGTVVVDPGVIAHARGDLTLTADSTVAFGIGKRGKYGLVKADGAAQLGGTLTVAIAPGAYVTAGAQIPIVTAAGGISGTFATIDATKPYNAHYVVDYGATTATLVAVPDNPIGLSVFGSVLLDQNAIDHQVVVRGSGFQPGAAVVFSDPTITSGNLRVVDNSRITLDVTTTSATPTGRSDVTVTNLDGTTTTCVHCVDTSAPPTYTGLSGPVAVGTTKYVYFEGPYYYRYRLDGLAVTGAPNAMTFELYSDYMYLTVPQGTTPGAYDVTFFGRNGGRDVCAGCLVVRPAPTVRGVAPRTARRGFDTKITLTGDDFASGVTLTSYNYVTFADVTVVGTHKITATVSVGVNAAPGPLAIMVTNGSAGGSGTSTFSGLTII